MNRGIAVAALALLFAGCAFETDEDGEETDESLDSLVGGERATSNMFPSTLLLETGCTAAKIGPRHILTAAHCVHDTKKNALMPSFRAGSALMVTAKKDVSWNKSMAANGFKRVVIEKTHMHPTWKQDAPMVDHGVVIRAPNVPADVAVIVLTPASAKNIASIRAAKVDVTPLADGDAVTLQGYGCRKGLDVADNSARDVLKFAREKTQPATTLLHPGSYFASAEEPGFVNTAGSYAVTPGRKGMAKAASLCPGDSGGPLYRMNGRADRIVGVNAYYSFAPEAEDPRKVSVTNWHTRLDVNARNGVATWLTNLGVATTR